jgi:hypothetical protein
MVVHVQDELSLPIDVLSLCRAEKLAFGEVAWLHDYDNALAFVGTVNQHPVVTLIYPDGQFKTRSVEDLTGVAQKLSGSKFIVDPLSVGKFDHQDRKLGALVVDRQGLGIAASPPSQRGYIIMRLGGEHAKFEFDIYCYPTWRLVVDINERPVMICGRDLIGG